MARVLVVDDEPAIRALIRSTLERAGHTVLEAADGPAALASAQTHLPDLVLLDVALPGLSGLEVCRRLKAEPRTAGTEILLLTGLPQAGASIPAGAEGCIAKPFTPDGIVRRVEQALLRRKEPAGRP
jgi:two-component system phosphate regulon response regulator PhoB